MQGTGCPEKSKLAAHHDYTVMADGQARYSPMCNEAGGVVDDLIVYKVRDELYFIVVNAANKDKDFAWMKAHQIGDVEFEDISDQVAQLALQGPKALEILKKLTREEDIPEKYYTFKLQGNVKGIFLHDFKEPDTQGRTEWRLYCAPADAPTLWEALMEAGKEEGLIPCGLGARDTLRLEAAMPLYGHEMDDSITPKRQVSASL